MHDVIKLAKFGDDRLRGSGVVAGQISAFPIDFAGRPYNTLTLPCERVITSICSGLVVQVVLTLLPIIGKILTDTARNAVRPSAAAELLMSPGMLFWRLMQKVEQVFWPADDGRRWQCS